MVDVEHIPAPPRRPERPGQILEATCRAILDRGFPATRISDIAREAGMSTGAVQYYFEGKDDVRRGAASGEFDPVVGADEVAERLIGLLDGMAFETVIGYSWTSPAHTRERVLDFAAEQLRISRSHLNRHSCAVPRTARGRAARP
jgi:AcrR family transcriptional regulator